jgi:integrase
VIKHNPAALVEKVGAKQGTSRVAFEADEVAKLLLACANWQGLGKTEWVTMVLLGLCTGARISDCSKMGVKHVIEQGEELTLRFSPQKNERQKLVVELPVVEPLRSHLKALLPTLPPNALFCPVVNALRGRGNASRVFGLLLDSCGIGDGQQAVEGRRYKWRQHSFHSLRHTLPTWLAAAGVPEDIRMKITGHATVKVARGYTHREMEDIRAALEKGLAKFKSAD